MDPRPDRKKTPDSPDEKNRSQVDQLRSELMANSLVHELTNVMHSCTDLDGIIKTVLLGIQEILSFDRIILFEVDKKHFRLASRAWVGIDNTAVRNLTVSLGFEEGEITDAVFLNRHLIIERPDASMDFFARTFHSRGYLVIPLVSKTTRRCWDVKACKKTNCPVYGGHNPYCWSVPGSSGANDMNVSENERRKRCVECPCFKVEGVFWMDRHAGGKEVSADDITTLSTIITQAAIIIENYRMYNAVEKANNDLQDANNKLTVLNHQLRVANAKIENDLEHARSIQRGLLPDTMPEEGETSVGVSYIPADKVGGDYYDFFEISPSLYGLVVADVSGHGVASSLIMSMVKVLLKLYGKQGQSPQKTLEHINDTFISEVKTDNFVTIFYAVLDTGSHVLRYTSAGHCPVLFIDKSNEAIRHIKADGLFLGVFPDMMLKETQIAYVPGRQRLVLYTDGLTEAQNDAKEMFELANLEKIALSTLRHSPQQAVEEIIDRHKKFCNTTAIEDDITLLVMDL